MTTAPEAVATARSLLFVPGELALATAATGRPAPIDGVTTGLGDEETLRADLAEALELGFTGKLAIHPRQVAAINECLAPTEADVAWAREVLHLATDGSVTLHDGQMVDRPVWLRARSIVARAAGRAG